MYSCSKFKAMESEQRKALIDQMVNARTIEEVQEAEEAAKTWLSNHPDDLQVIAACEHLDEAKYKADNPISWWSTIVAFIGLFVGVMAFIVIALLIGTNTGNWALAIGAGLLTGGTLGLAIGSLD